MARPVSVLMSLALLCRPYAHAQTPPRPGEARAEPVPYCELVLNPEKYDGQTILTEAVWERLFHSGALADRSCPRVGGRAALTAPAFSREVMHNGLGKTLGKILAKRGVAVVDLIGVFHSRKGENYGPDNQRYQIEIRSLLAVREITN